MCSYLLNSVRIAVKRYSTNPTTLPRQMLKGYCCESDKPHKLKGNLNLRLHYICIFSNFMFKGINETKQMSRVCLNCTIDVFYVQSY